MSLLEHPIFLIVGEHQDLSRGQSRLLTRPLLEDPKTRDWILSKIKLGRLRRMEALSGPLLVLASDASTMMTGRSQVADRGWTAG